MSDTPAKPSVKSSTPLHRNKYPTAQMLAFFSVVATCSVGCGAVGSLEKAKSTTQNAATGSSGTGSGDATSSGPLTLQLTANYTLRPVDLIIIRDGDSHAYQIDQQLQAALPLLTARVWNLGATVGSVNVGVFDHYFDANNKSSAATPVDTATPLIDASSPNASLSPANMSSQAFTAAISARVEAAGNRGGDPRPASVLLDVLATAAKPTATDTADANFFRPNAFWSILYIGAKINPDDPNDQDDVIAALKTHTNGYQISALTIDKGGCAFAGVTPPQQANPQNEPQRNLELKMQMLTGGIFGSVCANTYTVFMDDFVQKGTGTQYFPVTLPSPIDPTTLVITGPDHVPVSDFRYVPGSTELEVSTLIASGQAFTVTANALAAAPTPVVGVASGDANVPVATAP